jgi:heat shock protein HtpX
MELCLDNPREGFSDLFATHPSVQSRVQALVKYAGGHDPGPLALPSEAAPDDPSQPPENAQIPPPLPSGPWGAPGNPAGTPQGAPQATPQQPVPGPWSNPAGPWGRR